MADLELSPTIPVAGPARINLGSIELSIVPDVVLIHVAARKGQAPAIASAMKGAFDIELPIRPRRIANGDLAAIWAGPDQWLVTDFAAVVETEVRTAVGDRASVTNLSDARTVIRVSGPGARDMLARHVPIDLHPRAFGSGDVAITHASHIGVMLWQIDSTPVYELACFRSFAGTLWRWFHETHHG